MTILLIIAGVILFFMNPLIGIGFALCFVNVVVGGIIIGVGLLAGLASR